MAAYATFLVEDRYLGVPVERVQEVIRPQPLTRVPLAPDHVRGLLNLRGQIVTAIDLRTRLQLGPRDEATPSAHVVIAGDGGAVSMIVDTLGDVVIVDDDTFEAAPDSIEPRARRLIKGAYKLDDALLLDLDLDEAIALTTDLELV